MEDTDFYRFPHNKETKLTQFLVVPRGIDLLRPTPSCAALARGYSYLSPSDFYIYAMTEQAKDR
jgi:hypothetical protein